MKSLVKILSLALCLNVMIPQKKAEAGLILWLAGKEPTTKLFGLELGIAGGVTTIVGGVAYLITGAGSAAGVTGIGAVMLVLDEKGDNIADYISVRFPFIDDQLVVNDLASAIYGEYQKQAVDGEATVRLGENEVRTILAPLSISESELNLVINELK